MKRLSIKARVTAWFAMVMFLIASGVFCVMTLHRSAQIKINAENTLISAVNGFSETIGQRDGRVPPVEEGAPRGRMPQNGAFPGEPPQSDALQEGDAPQDGIPPVPDTGSELFFRDGKQPRTYTGGVHIAIYDENYESKLGQIPFELENMDFADGKMRTITSDGEKYLVLDKKITDDNGGVFWIKGVSNLSGAQNAVNSTVLADYLLICALIFIAAVGGYFIVGRALTPITKMRETAQKISDSNDLSKRIALGEGKDEVYRLASVFDEMLGKIQHSFESEKQFTSDASHELRTPVAVILSECEYALDCAKSQEEYKESLSVIKRQGDKMAKLISELLAISRMDKETFELQFETTNLSELLEIICDEQTEINTREITLTRDISENVWAKTDSSLIARLFINLIQNAFQYGKEGGNVHVSLKAENGQVIFAVSDDGIGISKEDLPNIWERFYRASKSRTGENGSMGLGLSMVKQIAQLHKGSVRAESALGNGSTFTFTMSAE